MFFFCRFVAGQEVDFSEKFFALWCLVDFLKGDSLPRSLKFGVKLLKLRLFLPQKISELSKIEFLEILRLGFILFNFQVNRTKVHIIGYRFGSFGLKAGLLDWGVEAGEQIDRVEVF